VWRSKDGGETWQDFSQGIFYPEVYSLAITGGVSPLLIAGSYGSGLYQHSLAVVADFTASSRSGHPPMEVSFTNQTAGTVNSYHWDFGDGTTSTQENPTHTYSSPGTYSVTLTATGSGDSDTEIKNDYITVTVPAPVAAFSANPTSGTAPLPVTFIDSSSGSIISRSWSFGDGTSSSAQNPTHTYNNPGIYSVSLTVTGDGGVDVTTLSNYIVVSKPLPTVTITAADPSAAESGKDTGTFQVSRTGNTSAPLTVFYTATGSAKNGIDYKKLPGKVTIRASQSYAKITLKPVDDAAKEKLEKVKVKLVGKPVYLLGSPRSAVVIMRDND
jgi:PKD repeat protein